MSNVLHTEQNLDEKLNYGGEQTNFNMKSQCNHRISSRFVSPDAGSHGQSQTFKDMYVYKLIQNMEKIQSKNPPNQNMEATAQVRQPQGQIPQIVKMPKLRHKP